MKISAVYITKNEEKVVEKSISSVKNIADEVIVVDTGSTDATVQICKKLNCEIYNYKWENDFAKARNYAISLCSGDIIIFLDADEYFEPALTEENKEHIENLFIQYKNLQCLACPTIDQDRDTGKKIHTSYLSRVFKKSPSIGYKGSIHEQLVDFQTGTLETGAFDGVQLIHTGYSSAVIKNKVKRNLEILKNIDDKSTMIYFYLARENLSTGNFEEARENIEIFFNRKDVDDIIKGTNIAYLAYFYNLFIMDHFTEEFSTKQKIRYLENLEDKIGYVPELYYHLGKYYYYTDLKKSLEHFQNAIKVNEEFSAQHTEMNNYVSFEPDIYYQMGKISEALGNRGEAIRRATVACMLDKKDKDYKSFLISLLNPSKPKENLAFLEKVFCPKTKEDYGIIVGALENSRLYQEFVATANLYNQKYGGNSISVFYAMIISGFAKLVIDCLLKTERTAQMNFVFAIALLYVNKEKFYEQYLEFLPDNLKNIIGFLRGEKIDESKIDINLLNSVVCKLSIYQAPVLKDDRGIYLVKNYIYILNHAEEATIRTLIAGFYSAGLVKDLCGILSFYIEETILIEEKQNLSNKDFYIVNQYLLALHKKNVLAHGDEPIYVLQIDELEYFTERFGMENFTKQYIFLKTLPKKKMSKQTLKRYRNLMKEMKSYAEA